MGWLFESLIITLMTLTAEVINFFLETFADFELDIGYDKSAKLIEFFEFDYYRGEGRVLTSVFDKVFGGAYSFFGLFVYAGYAILIAGLLFKLYQALFGPLAKGQTPLTTAVYYVLGFVLVTYSYSLFVCAEKAANQLYLMFKGQFDVFRSQGLPNITDYLLSPDKLFKGGLGTVSGLTLTVIALVFFLTLLAQFVRLLLEAFERYVVVGVLFYTSPLAAAGLPTETGRKVFANWCQMVISQFLLMYLNLFFIAVFYIGFASIFSPADPAYSGFASGFAKEATDVLGNGDYFVMELGSSAEEGYVFSSAADFIFKMSVLIGWLTVAQRIDEHLRSLGLSIAQTGKGLASTLAAGAYLAKSVIKDTAKAGGKAAGLAETARASVEKEEAVRSKANEARERIQKQKEQLRDPRLPKNMSESDFKEQTFKRSEKGDITAQAASDAISAPKTAEGTPIKFTDSETRSVMQAAGLDPEAEVPVGMDAMTIRPSEEEISDAIARGDEPPAEHSDIVFSGEAPARVELEDGKITSYAMDESILREEGLESRYEATGAYALYETRGRGAERSYMVRPLTQNDINKESYDMAERVRDDMASLAGCEVKTWSYDPKTASYRGFYTDSEGKSVLAQEIRMGRNLDGSFNGTLTGYRFEEGEALPAYQAALDQVASYDPSYGNAVRTENGNRLKEVPLGRGVTYSVQNLEDEYASVHYHSGYENIKPASDVRLIRKQVERIDAVKEYGIKGFGSVSTYDQKALDEEKHYVRPAERLSVKLAKKLIRKRK